MIQANELRIGNWLEVNNDSGGYVQVTEINKASFEARGDEVYPRPEQCAPINLTPEILDKADFVTIDNGIFCYKDFNLYGPSHFRYSLSNMVILGEVKYLHQLQNLYFALTETELNVQL